MRVEFAFGDLMPPAGKTGTFALAAAVALGAAGCSRPEWTNPEASKGSRRIVEPVRKTIPLSKRPAPAIPAWVAPLIGKPVRAVFPRDGVCIGNTDAIAWRFADDPPRVLVIGWVWEPGAKAPAPRVVLTDPDGLIVGGGDSGAPRPDVARVLPSVTSQNTGWEAVSPVLQDRVVAHGVVEGGKAICPLAGAAF